MRMKKKMLYRKNVQEVKRSRKRVKDPSEWEHIIRKRQSGVEYTRITGRYMKRKEIKTVKDCQGKCRFKCAQHFSVNDRKQIFDNCKK